MTHLPLQQCSPNSQVLFLFRFGRLPHRTIFSLFARLISHQPAVLFSQNKPATSNQLAVLFSQNKSAPAIGRQPTEQAVGSRNLGTWQPPQ
jgi:hypothetical protein